MTACSCCEQCVALTRVRRRRLWSILAIAFTVAPVAWIPLAFAYTRLAMRMVVAIEDLDAATLQETKRSLAPAPPPAPQPSAPQPPASVPAVPVGLGILKLSGTVFLVDRRVFDLAVENQADWMRSPRIVPDQEHGRVVGIRLFGVRPDSLLGLVGFENGDRLESINGFDVFSPDRAVELYERLRTVDDLSIIVDRRQSKVRLQYHID